MFKSKTDKKKQKIKKKLFCSVCSLSTIRDVIKFAFISDDVQTSNIFSTFKIH